MVNGALRCLLNPDIDLGMGAASLSAGLPRLLHPLYAFPCLGPSGCIIAGLQHHSHKVLKAFQGT